MAGLCLVTLSLLTSLFLLFSLVVREIKGVRRRKSLIHASAALGCELPEAAIPLGLVPGTVEILASDTLVPTAQSRRTLQLHRTYVSRIETSKDDYSFSQKYEKIKKGDRKDLVLLPSYAWFRVGGFLLCTSFMKS